MLGAIIGDLAGSIYEFDQFTKHSNVKIKNIIEDNSFYSDDTILTIAIVDAIINNVSYEEKLKEYGIKFGDSVPKIFLILKQCFLQDLENGLKAIIKVKVRGMVQ